MESDQERIVMAQSMLDKLSLLRQTKACIQGIYESEKEAVIPPEVKTLLDAVDIAYLPQLMELAEATEQLEKDIREYVLAHGYTVKGTEYQAVWSKGRITWQDDFLQGFAVAHPEILQARCESNPMVSIRKIERR